MKRSIIAAALAIVGLLSVTTYAGASNLAQEEPQAIVCMSLSAIQDDFDAELHSEEILIPAVNF